jgi:diaminopimelate epimerase
MEPISFIKMTGAGNDFILIDNRSGAIDVERGRELARLACRRKLSVGADGLILLENDPEVDFKWVFFNADGSEPEMCGNGARCAVRFARLAGIVGGSRVAFRTLAGIIHAEMGDERVKVRTTRPHGLEAGISLEAEGRSFTLDFLNTGVPHAVCFLEDDEALDNLDVFRWGGLLRRHPRFQPAGTNVNFALVRDEKSLRIRTYERGVEAETLACGTGSIASALLAARRQGLASPVGVETASGEVLAIHFTREGSDAFGDVCLEGSASVVYEGKLWDETLR